MQVLPSQVTQNAPDTTSAAADTVTLVEQLESDSTIYRLTDPDRIGQFWSGVVEDLLNPNLWLGVLGVAVQVILVLALAWIAIRFLDKATARWTRRFESLPALHARRQRAYTITNLITSTARYVIWPVAIIMALSELGYEIGPLIATAGIAGLAIGFGAQTLVKDVISGIFLLFDDTLHVGDLVRVDADSGTVEFVGVRLIKVRKFNGEVLMVPAGELRIFGNRSVGFARVVLNVGLSYEQDTETILPVMERVAKEWAATKKEILLEEAPQVQAITDFLDSAVMVRIVVQVIPGEQFAAERELRIRLKREFDRLGIEIPFPRQIEYSREEKTVPKRTIQDPGPLKDEAADLGND